MPGLARDGHVELGPLQKADRLPDEDVSQALALHGEGLASAWIERARKGGNLLLIADLGRTICRVDRRRID